MVRKVIIAIFLIGSVVYFNSLSNGFVGDDESLIVNNAPIYSLSNFPMYFTGGSFYSPGYPKLVGNYYKPILLLYNSIVYSIFGSQPFFFHLFQVSLHVFNAVILFLIFRYFFRLRIAFITSLVFLIHPINVESVAYISATQETLFFLFGISALWWTIYQQSRKYSRWILGLLLLLSLLSKETGVVFIFLITVFDYFFNRKFLKVHLITSGSALAIYLFMRLAIGGIFLNNTIVSPIMRAGGAIRLLTMPKIIYTYLFNFFFPKNLAFAQNWLVTKPNVPDLYFPLAIILILILSLILIYFRLAKHPADKKTFLFFLVWITLGMALHLQIIPLDGTYSDRWFYLPIAGFIGLIGMLYEGILNSKRERIIGAFTAITLLVLILLGIRTVVRNEDWKNNYTLVSHDVLADPDNFVLENSLGSALIGLHRYEEAEIHLKKSVNLFPTFLNWNNLGVTYAKRGRFTEAVNAYKSSLTYGHFYLAYVNYVIALYNSKDYSGAITQAEKALAVFPQNSQLWLFWGLSKYQLGENEAAKRGLLQAYFFSHDQSIFTYLNDVDNDRKISLPAE